MNRLLPAMIVLLALIARVGWVSTLSSDDDAIDALPDQREYLDLGNNLLVRHQLSFFDGRFGQTVYAYRTPGYPIFVAMCGGSIGAVRVAQAVLDAFTPLAAFLIARRFLDARAALFAMILVAANPFLIYFTGLVLSETLYTALLAWGIAAIVSRRRVAVWLIAPALLALSAMVRPGAIALPILIAAMAIIVGRENRPLLVAVPVSLLALFAPWALRNQRLLGVPIVTTTNAGVTLYDGMNPRATGASDQSFLAAMPELRDLFEVQRNTRLHAAAIAFAREHPAAVASLVVPKLARLWSPVPLSEEHRSNSLQVAAGLVYAVPLFLLTAVGLFSRRLSRSVKCLLMLPAIYFSIVHAITVGSLRYRVPADVLMAVVAASVIARNPKLPPRQLAHPNAEPEASDS